jgi:hypothetical protein
MDIVLGSLDALYKFIITNSPVLADKAKNIVADLFVVYAILKAGLPLLIAFLTALWDWVLGLVDFGGGAVADVRALRSGKSVAAARSARNK